MAPTRGKSKPKTPPAAAATATAISTADSDPSGFDSSQQQKPTAAPSQRQTLSAQQKGALTRKLNAAAKKERIEARRLADEAADKLLEGPRQSKTRALENRVWDTAANKRVARKRANSGAPAEAATQTTRQKKMKTAGNTGDRDAPIIDPELEEATNFTDAALVGSQKPSNKARRDRQRVRIGDPGDASLVVDGEQEDISTGMGDRDWSAEGTHGDAHDANLNSESEDVLNETEIIYDQGEHVD
ncbi:hypothetical protein BV25DRAFT_1917888 [Artomyces pyxidatus]|uniref:Uncharacterized protein n=1 Tax=Artomyces pyxidatus TaxID=48021 RepID=A0ACB8SV58_9AGAM|nr:hypothetical protein BV25DRAFT_1917888 [Artomyces pyxidatus]